MVSAPPPAVDAQKSNVEATDVMYLQSSKEVANFSMCAPIACAPGVAAKSRGGSLHGLLAVKVHQAPGPDERSKHELCSGLR